MGRILTPPNNITVSVGNLDVSSYFISAQGAYSAIDTGGIVVATGDLLLSYKGIENISTQIGTQVRIRRGGELLAVIGSLLVEGWELDERREVLTLKLTCALGLNNSAELAKVVVCLRPDQSAPASTVVSTILDSFNIPNLITLSGNVSDIQLTRNGTGAISYCGEVAFAKGKFLYTGRDGIVRAQDYGVGVNGLTLDENESSIYRFLKSYNTTLPASRYELSSGSRQVEQIDLSETGTDVNAGITTQTTKTIAPGGRVITNTTTTTGLSSPYVTNGSRIVTVTETYETNKRRNADGCTFDDPGRMLTRTTSIQESIGISFTEFIATRLKYEEENGGTSTLFDYNNVVTTSLITESWEYNYNEPDGQPRRINIYSSGSTVFANLSNNYIQQTITESRATGLLIPWAGHKKLGRQNEPSEINVNHLVLTSCSQVRNKWIRSKNRRQWDLQTLSSQSPAFAIPSEAQQFAVNAVTGTTLTSIISNVLAISRSKNERNTNEQPSEPGRFPTLYSVIVEPFVFYVDAATNGLRRTQTFNIEPTIVGSASTSKTLLQQLMKLDFGRYNSFTVSGAADNLALGAIPLSGAVVNVEGISRQFAMDSLAVYIERDAFIYSFEGLLFSINGSDVITDKAEFTSNDIDDAQEYLPWVLLGVVDPNDNYLFV